ncbi:MAG: ATP-binding cassette domain-containing protein [Vallitaleaceae bacterium]|jgi:putative ABC transport system ATP-binding protein|nr:ATP-binding cassette domain-containing protein [Vallitaleaceae bacterium]
MITFENVAIDFDNKSVIQGFDLVINKGDKVLFKAPSGKGKSSLLKAVLGFVTLSEGTILIDQIPVTEKTACDLRSKVAYVSQDVDLMPQVARDFIQEVYDYKYNKHLELDNDRLIELMTYYELELSLLDKNIKDFSGGERQRLGLVIAFLLNREILLLDEVTSGLDAHLKSKVFDYVSQSTITAIIISHDEIWINELIKVVNW